MNRYETQEAHTAAQSFMVGGPLMTLKSWADVDRLTDDLDAIADWQDDLRSRIARATAPLRADRISIHAEQEELEAEVQEFKRVCRGLSFGRLGKAGRRHEQRRTRR